MKSKFAFASLCVMAALSLTGCFTMLLPDKVAYRGPNDYVAHYNPGKPKTITQTTLTESGKDLQATYDDEFVYDAKGNLVKHKQTEYVEGEKGKKEFVVYETEYKVVGGVVLPASASINGVPYLELEYETLSVTATGEVKPTTATRYFLKQVTDYSYGTRMESFDVSLDNFSVDFKPDDKFIKTITRYSNGYYGTRVTKANVLSLGFDNVVLKKYSFNLEKMAEGLKKSYTGQKAKKFAKAQEELKDSTVSFDFAWEAIGGKICQKKASFFRKLKINGKDDVVYFYADMKYNAAGDCTE